MQWTADSLFNKERFEAWLATQPAQREFDYMDIRGCALCAFVKENTSIKDFSAGSENVSVWNGCGRHNIPIPEWIVSLIKEARIHNKDICHFSISNLRTAYHKLFGIDLAAEPTIETVNQGGKV